MSTRPLKKLRLVVGEDYNVPEIYTTGQPEEIEEALWIGATVVATVAGRRGDDNLRAMTESKEKEIAAIRSRYQQQEAELRQQLVAASNAATQSVAAARKEERASAEAEIAAAKGRCEALESRRKELETNREADIAAAVARAEALMQKVVQAKEDQIARMEAAHARLQDGLTKHSEELVRLSAAVQKKSIANAVANANVKTKGSDYEAEFREKLLKAYGLCKGFSLKETRLGSGHEMDFVMTMEGQTVMWELKDYSATVPKQEIDKFMKDLRGNAEARIGVMISRSTDITGKCATGDFTVEMEDDKLMIYIGRFELWADETKVFQTLAALFRIWWVARRPVEEETGINREELVRELEKQLADVAKRRTEWKTHKGRIDDMLRWTTDLLEEAEGRLDRLLKAIRGVASGSVLPVPTGIFREADDDRSRQWVQSILSVSIASPDASIELRDLVDKLAEIHKLSKDTIRSHVKSVLLDSSIEKGKGNVAIIKGLSFAK